jgi:hypothetical protein
MFWAPAPKQNSPHNQIQGEAGRYRRWSKDLPEESAIAGFRLGRGPVNSVHPDKFKMVKAAKTTPAIVFFICMSTLRGIFNWLDADIANKFRNWRADRSFSWLFKFVQPGVTIN